MHRQVISALLSLLAASAVGVCVPLTAEAAAPLQQPIMITPSSGCGLLTAYTAGTGLPAWSDPPPSCGTGAFTLAFNQGNTPPPPTQTDSHGVGTAGSALSQAWLLTGVPEGARMGYRITTPPGITINKVVYDLAQLQNIADGHGWIGLTYWNDGTAQVQSPGTAVDAAASGPLNTPYWGIELRCVEATCPWPGKIQLDQFTISASETQGPSIAPTSDPTSLWNQHGWVWNPPADPWPLAVAATAPGGICSLNVQSGAGPAIADPSLPGPNDSSWLQCQQSTTWGATLDTREYISGAGQMPMTLQATDAAGLVNPPMSETLNVDNDPVSVSLSTPDDPNPTVWVNHGVTVNATPSTGPSGLGGLTCGVDGGSAQSYPAGGLIVDGNGVRTVSCTVWNNAVDPQGEHNSSTSTVTLHIDESPPSISFEPENPADPTGVVVDTSDAESGVAGGSIEMAPAGTNEWTSLPASFDGSQLTAHFEDAGLTGVWQLAARACDNVGNCASATRTLTLPVRDGAVAQVSLQGVNRCVATKPAHRPAAARSKHRSRHHMTGAHPRPARDLRSNPTLRSPAGVTLLSASRMITRSAAPRKAKIRRRARSGRARELVVGAAVPAAVRATASSCVPGARATSSGEVPYGFPVTVRGRLVDSQGQPLAGQTVSILTAPDNASNAFTPAGAVTTAADGSWTATLPAGPSRIIQASYAGSATILPASGYATVITPAEVRITRVTPDRIGWGGVVTIRGRVLGGYVPASSKLLRLDLGIVGIPGFSKIQGIPSIAPDGTFTTRYKFARGFSGVARFWLEVSSLPEADFPWAAAHSPRVIVTVGVATPNNNNNKKSSSGGPALRRPKHSRRAVAGRAGGRLARDRVRARRGR